MSFYQHFAGSWVVVPEQLNQFMFRQKQGYFSGKSGKTLTKKTGLNI